jgi:magnesium-transporting ATPase (P-type)
MYLLPHFRHICVPVVCLLKFLNLSACLFVCVHVKCQKPLYEFDFHQSSIYYDEAKSFVEWTTLMEVLCAKLFHLCHCDYLQYSLWKQWIWWHTEKTELLLQQRAQTGPNSLLYLFFSLSTSVNESVGNPIFPYYIFQRKFIYVVSRSDN